MLNLGLGRALLPFSLFFSLASAADTLSGEVAQSSTGGHSPTVELSEHSIERGERLSHIVGCDRCHGEGAGGAVFLQTPGGSRFIAPSIPAAIGRYSRDEIEAIVRHGRYPDGSVVWSGMPAYQFKSMSDVDYAAIIGYLESLPKRSNPLPNPLIGEDFDRLSALRRKNADIGSDIEHPSDTPTTSLALGEYLATLSCIGCHGVDYQGARNAPNLIVITAYSREDFGTLMRDGLGVGGRQLETMRTMVAERFIYLTEDELDAIYNFLRKRVRTI
ncbi:MAG: c-type cytochrome [Gemmatimonadales bacterium]|jgi:mono/diheme cytochrome c family protein